MKLETVINRKIQCLALSVVDKGLEVPLYGHMADKIDWELEFHTDRYFSTKTHTSRLVFEDSFLLTQKMLTELYQDPKTRLKEVGSLRLTSLRIALRGPTTSSWERAYHIAYIGGTGYHSIVEHAEKPFTIDVWTNEPVNEIVDMLLRVALEELS